MTILHAILKGLPIMLGALCITVIIFGIAYLAAIYNSAWTNALLVIILVCCLSYFIGKVL